MSFQNLTGQLLGQYELRELLGVGGMGAVYRAHQVNLERAVAVKVLSPHLANEPGYIERFYREARTAAALEHTHIVPIHDYGVQGDLSYVTMRLLTGGTLNERLQQRKETRNPLPSLGETVDILKQLASALDYAHSQGVIHRDVKPSNVMFDNQGNAFLVDFGIAKMLESTHSMTATGTALGTPSYMPPEQWRAEDLTPAADQYALGVMIYALVAGRVPFEAPTPYGLMHRHLNDTPTPPQTYRSDIPDEVSLVLERALAKRPLDRFPTVTAFAQAYERAVGSQRKEPTGFWTFRLPNKPKIAQTPASGSISGSSGSRPVSASSQSGSITPMRPLYRHPLMWLATIVIVLLAGALLAQILGSSGDGDKSPSPTVITGPIIEVLTTPTFTPQPTITPVPSDTLLPIDTPDQTGTFEAALAGSLTAIAAQWTDKPSPTMTWTYTPTDQPSPTTTWTYTPVTSPTNDLGVGPTLSQTDIQELIDQAVATQLAALIPTATPIPPTPTSIPLEIAADDDAFLGPADAPVTIVEFADYQCEYCNRWAQQVLPKIIENYPYEVRYIYRDFPIFGDDSVHAAMAAECAEESGRFWDMHNYLFDGLAGDKTIDLDEDSLVSAAGEMGINRVSFRECLSGQRYLEEIIDDAQTAQGWGFGGTPSFIINGVVYPFGAQPFEVFNDIILSELAAMVTNDPTAELTEVPTAEPTVEPTVVPTAVAVAMAGADLGVVKMGMNAEYQPFEFVDENGEIAGFDVDLIKAIAANQGFEVELINTRWDGIFVALQQGEFDAVASAATITEEREEIIDFSNPYFNAGQTIAVTVDNPKDVQTIEDLPGLRVGVQNGVTGDMAASDIEGVEVVRYDEITLAFQALANGDVDAIVNDGPVSADIISHNPDLGVTLVGDPFTDEFYGIAVRVDFPGLLVAINEGLAAVIADGTYNEIHKKWFGVDAPSMFQPGGAEAEDESETPAMSLLNLAEADGRFGSLLNMVDMAGARELLEGEGPFTVFAPTDEAMGAMMADADLVNSMLSDPELLKAVLLYHVVEGQLLAADVAALSRVKMVQGQEIAVVVSHAGIVLNGSVNVIETDMIASNGIIHVIDGALMPPPMFSSNAPSDPVDAMNDSLIMETPHADVSQALFGGSAPSAAIPSPTVVVSGYITADSRVRSGPGTTFDALGSVNKGKLVNIYSQYLRHTSIIDPLNQYLRQFKRRNGQDDEHEYCLTRSAAARCEKLKRHRADREAI